MGKLVNFKSAFKNYTQSSYVVLLKYGGSNGYIETISKREAMNLCADFKKSHRAECYKVDCMTSEPIRKLS